MKVVFMYSVKPKDCCIELGRNQLKTVKTWLYNNNNIILCVSKSKP